MTIGDEDRTVQETPPYFSGTTFFNFVEAHRRTQPTRIDRSIMGSIAGGDQARILKALRFFDLIDDDGHPTESFKRLRDIEGDEIQGAWAMLLRQAYPYLFSGFNLEKATQGQLEERFREQGIKGDTVRKAVTFFIAMARFAGLTLSPYFKPVRQRSGRTLKKTPVRIAKKEARADSKPPQVGDGTPESEGAASAKTIHFRSGGTATLSVSVNVVNLSPADRKALFAWIDAMSEYENGAQADT